MIKPKICVIGADSMVGSRFADIAKDNFDLILAGLSDYLKVDITKQNDIENLFSKNNFACAVLFSAFTNVDQAEKQRGEKNGQCWKINVEGTENISQACKKYNRKLIFISTDFVFDGTKGPYSEKNETGPNLDLVSWYGITKIEAEKIVEKILGPNNYVILRIAYPYRGPFEKKEDIIKRIINLHQQGNLYPMFFDQKITPTFIDDLKKAIWLLISKKQFGVFHLASPKITSQYEFAVKVIKTFGGNSDDVRKSSIVDFLKSQNATPRPINGGLKVNKFKLLGFEPTDFEKGIEEVYKQSN